MKASLILVIGGVFLFSIALYIILSIYNRFFVPSYLKNKELYKDTLKTPSDTDEAVKLFIIKNKLK